MSSLVAISHIAGALIALTLLNIFDIYFNMKFSERHGKALQKQLAIDLGVSSEAFKTSDLTPRLMQLMAVRFSGDLAKNRISDICGRFLNLWVWLGFIVQAIVIIGVVWYAITESTDLAIYAWSVTAAYVFFFISSISFSFSCWIITGRLPGEASRTRAVLAKTLDEKV